MNIDKDTELLEEIAQERIEMLLHAMNRKRKNYDKNKILKAESIIDSLAADDKEALEYYIGDIFELMAMEENYLYKNGFIDGVKVVQKLSKL